MNGNGKFHGLRGEEAMRLAELLVLTGCDNGEGIAWIEAYGAGAKNNPAWNMRVTSFKRSRTALEHTEAE